MITCREEEGLIRLENPLLHVAVRTSGYVSGTAKDTFRDKRTGLVDRGSGLHVMDFLLAPGWREDTYARDRTVHGDLPRHYVEGPQICTRAGTLDHAVVCCKEYAAVRQWFTFTEAGQGYLTGSRWEQTLLFLPEARYFLSCECITSANSVDDLFYRIDMPGHLRHERGDTFQRIYLSHHGTIDSSAFLEDFAPDERFLYVRDDAAIPDRFIRAYELRSGGGASAWLAGMTLDPTLPCEAWCHQRGYVCFIQEIHRRPVRSGETFGAAYIVGYFDSIEEMERTYDAHRGIRHIALDETGFDLRHEIPQNHPASHRNPLTS